MSVTFAMSTEGILEVIAKDLRTDRRMTITLEGAIMSDTERVAAMERLEKLAEKIE